MPETVTRAKTKRNGRKVAQSVAPEPEIPYTLQEILKLKLQGLPNQKIGEQFGVTRQAIDKRLKGLWNVLDPEKIDNYKRNRMSLLDAAEAEALTQVLQSLMQPELAKKIPFLHKVTGFGVLFDKRRLEAGESTSNVAWHGLIEHVHRELERPRPPQQAVAGAQEDGTHDTTCPTEATESET